MTFSTDVTSLGGILDRITSISLQIHNSANLTEMLDVTVQ